MSSSKELSEKNLTLFAQVQSIILLSGLTVRKARRVVFSCPKHFLTLWPRPSSPYGSRGLKSLALRLPGRLSRTPIGRQGNSKGRSPLMELNTHPEISDKRERSLQIAHELVDKIKVREAGMNRGAWVLKFLASVGLGGGYAWCAAFVNFCQRTAGVDKKALPKHGASVLGWVDWAKANGRHTVNPERGDLFWWLDGSHGHIGFYVRETEPGEFETLEGNTNAAGSREGDGAYRKRRLTSQMKRHKRSGFISLEGL